jgi:hypothetical protein
MEPDETGIDWLNEARSSYNQNKTKDAAAAALIDIAVSLRQLIRLMRMGQS